MPKKEISMRATIIEKTSLHLRFKFVKSVQNNFNISHFKNAFQAPYKFCTLFGFKDTLDKKICSDLAYLYSCSSCNATYYGKTYGHFFARTEEHIKFNW